MRKTSHSSREKIPPDNGLFRAMIIGTKTR
jgi:hypothetical protein